jgi:GH25 family lysozyme M1 (1,4-beta-N-acetylmuramidase)
MSANANGVTVIQEDTGLQVAMFVGTLAYYLPTAGMVSGWLRPKFTAPVNVNPQSGPVTPILLGNQRMVGGANINERATAHVNAPVVRVAAANTMEQFTGWVHGDKVTVGSISNDIWFTDAQGAEWSGGFTDQGTHDLKDMNTPAALLGNQRWVGAGASNVHKTATTGSPVIRVAAAHTIEQFTGFVHGEKVTVNGQTTDVWFVDDLPSAQWSGNFDDQGVHDLPDKTPAVVTPPVVTPPVVTPPVVTPPVVDPGPAALDLIDVSRYQAEDISTIKADGFIIGVTYGIAGASPVWKQQLAEARKVSDLIGLYHIPARGTETAQQAAAFFWAEIKDQLTGGERLFLDFEEMDLTNTGWAGAFMDALDLLSGGASDIYMSQATERDGDWAAAVTAGRRLWISQYPWSVPKGPGTGGTGFVHWSDPPVPVHWPHAEGWQYTSHGRTPEFPNDDMDFSAFYETAADWNNRAVRKAPVVVTPPAGPTPEDSINLIEAFITWEAKTALQRAEAYINSPTK